MNIKLCQTKHIARFYSILLSVCERKRTTLAVFFPFYIREKIVYDDTENEIIDPKPFPCDILVAPEEAQQFKEQHRSEPKVF